MKCKAALPEVVNGYLHETTVPDDDVTLRLVAEYCHANIPAEKEHIKWYRKSIVDDNK